MQTAAILHNILGTPKTKGGSAKNFSGAPVMEDTQNLFGELLKQMNNVSVDKPETEILGTLSKRPLKQSIIPSKLNPAQLQDVKLAKLIEELQTLPKEQQTEVLAQLQKLPIDQKFIAQVKDLLGKVKDVKVENVEMRRGQQLINQEEDENLIPFKQRPRVNAKDQSIVKNYNKEQNLLNESLIKPMPIKNVNFSSPRQAEVASPANVLNMKMPREERQLLREEQGARELSSVTNLTSVQKESLIPSDVRVQPKVFNLTAFANTDVSELVDKIADYVRQTQIQGRQALDLTVHHQELGDFNINVSRKGKAEGLEFEIRANTAQGQNFFVEHEAKLIQALNNSGIKVTDMKIFTSLTEFAKFDGDGKGFSQDNLNSNSQWKGSEQHQGRQQHSDDADSRRRRDLWEQFKERFQA